jgi:hypothetical protein
MRKYGTLAEVAHAWANQLEGPTSTSNGSLFWEDDTIYSYGTHFALAKFRDDLPGYKVLFNTTTYSSSTSNHQSMVNSALGYRREDVLELNVDAGTRPVYVYEHLYETVEDIFKILPRQKVGFRPYEASMRTWAAFIQVQETLGPLGAAKYKIPAIPDDPIGFSKEQTAEYHRLREQADAKRREEQRILVKKRAKTQITDLQDWHNHIGKNVFTTHLVQHLRLKNGDPEVVETSMGATFPADHARVAWKRISQFYKTGRPLPDIRFGHFRCDGINNEGTLWAGCHRIPKDEVLRFAKELGI